MIIFFTIISLIEIPFKLLMWLDFLICSFCKLLGLVGIIVAIILMPFTGLNNIILATLTYTKYNIIGKKITYNQAMDIILSKFTE